MSIARKIFKTIQYISLAVFIYLLILLIINDFKYTQVKIFISSASVFITCFLFLMLTENNRSQKKTSIYLITALLFMLCVFIFNIVLFEIISPAHWQKFLFLSFPPALLLAANNQILMHTNTQKTIFSLINHFLFFANIFILLPVVIGINLPLAASLIPLTANFILSMLLLFKKK